MQLEWLTSVDGLSREEWDACFEPGAVLTCYDLAKAVERSHLPGTQLHYLLGRKDGRLKLVAPCYLYSADLDVLAPTSVRRLCRGIRRALPSFLVTRVFIIGSPLAICGDALGLRQVSGEPESNIISQLKGEWL